MISVIDCLVYFVEWFIEYIIDIYIIVGKLVELYKCREELLYFVGEDVVEKVYVKGKLMVCECIYVLLDEDLFVELDVLVKYCSINFNFGEKCLFGDGVVIGYGIIDGCDVCIFS